MEQQKRVIALGFFDGVHMGHGALLRTVAERARVLGAAPCAFTFDQSPAAAVTGRAVPLLTGVADRARLMEELYGIQEVIVAPFEVMRQMDWRDFVAQYLQKELGVGHVVAGHDFHFGYKGEGDPRRLAEKCRELGMGCDIIPKVEIDGITVSSTYIRALLAQGELEQANRFLGHPYCFSGVAAQGRDLGLPAVELPFPAGVMAPVSGAYAARACFDGQSVMAVAGVGAPPAVDGSGRADAEVFLPDFHGDLYGRTVRLEFYKYLRPEWRFPTPEALRGEVMRSAEQTRQFFKEAR